VAALAIRFLNWPGVFRDGEVYFFGTDSYAHIRRIWLCVLHYPVVAAHDPYLNFPEGTTWLWPPGLDLLLATASSLASRFTLNSTTEAVAACAIPFWGCSPGPQGGWYEPSRQRGIAVILPALLPAHVRCRDWPMSITT
jgi:asparagine N-glycosylation enzyme membrane subunit Stt3